MNFGNMGFGDMGNMAGMGRIFRMQQAWSTFKQNHPKVPVFMNNVQNKGFCEDMEIAIAVRYPDGEEFKSGIRVTQSDLELLNMLKSMNQ